MLRLGLRATRVASPKTLEDASAIDRWFIAVIALREHIDAFEHPLGKSDFLSSAELSFCGLYRRGRTFENIAHSLIYRFIEPIRSHHFLHKAPRQCLVRIDRAPREA